MLFVYFLGCAKAIGRAWATETTSPDCSVTESSNALYQQESTSMIYGETPTCSEECMSMRDASEALKTAVVWSTMIRPTLSNPAKTPDLQDILDGIKDIFPRAETPYTVRNPHYGPLPQPDTLEDLNQDPWNVGPNVEGDEKNDFETSFSASMSILTLFNSVSEPSSTDQGAPPPFELDTTITIARTRVDPWQSDIPGGFNPDPPVTTTSSSSEALSSSVVPSTTPLPSSSTSANPTSVPLSLSKGEIVGIVVVVLAVLLAVVVLALLYRRFVSRHKQASPQPPDTQLVGFPYPAPLLSPSYSPVRGWRDSRDVQMAVSKQGTTNTGITRCDEFDHATSSSVKGDLTRSMVGQQCTSASDELGVSALGSSEGRKSRSTIEDILSAYTTSSQSELEAEKNDSGTYKRAMS
ncbi:hypothetical protein G7Z17_g13266 [Cylindrodendrum hubeiense]|uniref:Uncharacterized protein n=1 Tax=Cylindrodendrum hubeiense TaxID=595255 RepID=A0A9P5L8E8_9HYPO|nr:hypothetical protein G7Z17_g13266 [Cylindrodendrum hubeiense]